MTKAEIARNLNEFLYYFKFAHREGIPFSKQKDNTYFLFPGFLVDFEKNQLKAEYGKWVIDFTSSNGQYFYNLEKMLKSFIKYKDTQSAIVIQFENSLKELTAKYRDSKE